MYAVMSHCTIVASKGLRIGTADAVPTMAGLTVSTGVAQQATSGTAESVGRGAPVADHLPDVPAGDLPSPMAHFFPSASPRLMP
jgi:hypothetical protein